MLLNFDISRHSQNKKNNIFFGIKEKKNFDGNKFVDQALKNGASISKKIIDKK